MTFDSTSKAKLLISLRAYLLAYANASAVTIASIVADRFYQTKSPAASVFPYLTMRFINGDNSAFGKQQRITIDAEIMIYGRPHAQLQTVLDIADLVEQALMQWRTTSGGAVWCRGLQRDTMPAGNGDIADAEVVNERMIAHLAAWPQYLTSLV